MDKLKIESQEKEKEEKLIKLHKDFTGYKYYGDKKYVLLELYKGLASSILDLKLRKDDVWVGGFSRSGIHWIAEMTWLIGQNLDYETALQLEHEDRIFYLDFQRKVFEYIYSPTVNKLNQEFFEDLPSPRYLKTHLPLSLLPPSLLDTCKMVYIARDPRDVALSCYYYYKTLYFHTFLGDFKEFWQLFKDANVIYCPYFDNVKEFWAKREHPNLLFLFYEDVLKDLPGTVRRISEFLGRKYTDQQYDDLCEHLSFSNMKQNKTINDDQRLGNSRTSVVRKGVSGGWREEFDEEMSREAEAWIAENLRDTDLRYPSMH